jgi:hypothetical protein
MGYRRWIKGMMFSRTELEGGGSILHIEMDLSLFFCTTTIKREQYTCMLSDIITFLVEESVEFKDRYTLYRSVAYCASSVVYQGDAFGKTRQQVF